MTKKIIAVDLDGTLLNGESKLSDFTKKTIKEISKKGHQIIIATGRPYRMAKDFYRELELETPMINFNGSLTHLPGKVWKYEKCLTVDKKYLLDMVKNFQPENQFNSDLVTKDPNCILLQTRVSDKYALAEEMNSFYKHQLNINTWGGPLNILECTPKGVHKAFALEYLIDVMNVDRKNLIAFGDEHNDTEMLAFAGTGYAMKNANPALLPFADEQLPLTNEEDGVAHFLRELFL